MARGSLLSKYCICDALQALRLLYIRKGHSSIADITPRAKLILYTSNALQRKSINVHHVKTTWEHLHIVPDRAHISQHYKYWYYMYLDTS